MSIPKYTCGDVIVPFCDAFFKFLTPHHRTNRCNTCFRDLQYELISCPTCDNVNYCNEECRQQDVENGHNLECRSEGYKKAMGSFYGVIHLLLYRLYAFIRSKPEFTTRPYVMYDGTSRCFNDLEKNAEKWGNDPESIDMAKGLVKLLKPLDDTVDVNLIINLLGVFASNAIRICDRREYVGYGIFMECTNFDHSCRPSANCFTLDGRLQISAMVDVEEGIAPTISYLDLGKHRSTRKRKKILMYLFTFDCQCQKCLLEAEVPFDYRELKSRIQTLDALAKRDTDSVKKYWQKIESLHTQLDTSLRTLFNEYDVVIIRHMYKFARLIVQMNFQDEKALGFVDLFANSAVRTAGFNSEMIVDELDHKMRQYTLIVDALIFVPREFMEDGQEE